eukprot:GILK01006194.1.p1 GENE.GILK01006194.1~~GILK01006194.1.p1  ORF type:complete len:851 (+),score=173.04 GILK01006194.1:207-2759(+)
MLVLIVDAFPHTTEGQRMFAEFEGTIRQAFQTSLLKRYENVQFILRTKATLDDYLFDHDTEFTDREALKAFDHLDFVFIDGDANLLPWLPSCRKINILFRMIQKSNKCLFGCSFVMQMMIYFAALGSEKIRVVNGKGRGGPIESLQSLTPDFLQNLRKGDCFLDSATGDLYRYESLEEEWVPFANTGMHNKHFAGTFGSLGSMVRKPPKYSGSVHKEILIPFTAKNTESKCTIITQYLPYYVFQQISKKDFIVPVYNLWDVHPLTNIPFDRMYSVLADMPTGPAIIELRNTVGCQFHIMKKYPETLQVVWNYIRHKTTLILDSERLDWNLEDSYIKELQLKFDALQIPLGFQRLKPSSTVSRLSTHRLNNESSPASTHPNTHRSSVSVRSASNQGLSRGGTKRSEMLLSSPSQTTAATAVGTPSRARTSSPLPRSSTVASQHSAAHVSMSMPVSRLASQPESNFGSSLMDSPPRTHRENSEKKTVELTTAVSASQLGSRPQSALMMSSTASLCAPVAVHTIRTKRPLTANPRLMADSIQAEPTLSKNHRAVKSAGLFRSMKDVTWSKPVNEINEEQDSRVETDAESWVNTPSGSRLVSPRDPIQQDKSTLVLSLRGGSPPRSAPAESGIRKKLSYVRGHGAGRLSSGVLPASLLQQYQLDGMMPLQSTLTTTAMHAPTAEPNHGENKENGVTEDGFRTFTKEEIRAILHPELAANDPTVDSARGDTQATSMRTVRVKVKSAPYSRWKEFHSFEPSLEERNLHRHERDRKVPPSIRAENIYLSPDERDRLEFVENKKRWTAEENFKSCFGKATKPQYIANYVARDPSQFPLLHRFREEDKHKWVGPHFVYH